MLRRVITFIGVAVAFAASVIAPGHAASAQTDRRAGWYVQRVLSHLQFNDPTQFALGAVTWVANSGTGELVTLPGGKVWARPDRNGYNRVSAVAVAPADHEVAYTVISGNKHPDSRFVLLRYGRPVYSVNLTAYERAHNPDAHVSYGTANRGPCVASAINEIFSYSHEASVRFTGRVESYPHAVAHVGKHLWAVTDQGANDVLEIDTAHRTVRTMAVLPREPLTFTKAIVAANNYPACLTGVTYYVEAHPTDVEAGARGKLFVSTFAEFALATSTYGLSRVYTVSPSRRLTLIGRGFDGALGLAVNPLGSVYVAENYRDGGVVSLLVRGRPLPVFGLGDVSGLEWGRGTLYASTTDDYHFGRVNGDIVRLAKR